MLHKPSYPPLVRPATDIIDTKDGVQITANMPGVSQQDLQVFLEGNLIHIKASSYCPIPSGEKDVHTLEFGNVKFELDIAVNGKLSTSVETRLDKGVLSVFLPRQTLLSNSPVFLCQDVAHRLV